MRAFSRDHQPLGIITALLTTLAVAAWAPGLQAAGHRDAPSLALDPGADISDVYAFRSWEDPSRVVFIMNVVPSQEPGDAPIFFSFDDKVLYRIHVDNDQNGVADDVVYEFRFKTEIRFALGEFIFDAPLVGHPDLPFPELQGIVALDGPGSEGITRRQTYTVTEVRGGKRTRLFDGQRLVAVPPNVGPNTMPDYEALAAQGIYADRASGIRVFAGQRAETFYADISALFDTGNLRGVPPLLTPAEDADDTVDPFGVNRFAGTNVNSIAIEVPITRITRDGRPPDGTSVPVIGSYASSSRQKVTILNREGEPSRAEGEFVQVARMGNPMVSTLLMDTPFKDRWNASKPEDDAQFQDLFTNPSPPRFPTTPFIFKVPSPPPPRLDVMSLYLKYPGQPLDGNNCGSPCAELLRLDLRVPPTPPESQKRMGALLGDPAGLPNGRRPNDDPVDFAVRFIGGPVVIAARLADGVNFAAGVPGAGTSDGPGYGTIPGNRLDVTPNGIAKEFPFLPTPHSGRDHRHHD